uniref:Uncharacterized protein n=1 Tax=Pyxicephalus adspersus TaxID=30357 RepID=A0AAV3APM2_PYXAD|nr:TPA: hypothetical protein GDO54_010661 [Pyxicephalus adspersus]
MLTLEKQSEGAYWKCIPKRSDGSLTLLHVYRGNVCHLCCLRIPPILLPCLILHDHSLNYMGAVILGITTSKARHIAVRGFCKEQIVIQLV